MNESKFEIGDRVWYDSDVFKNTFGTVIDIQMLSAESVYPWYKVRFDDEECTLNLCRFMPEQLIREEPMLALAGCLEPNQIENVTVHEPSWRKA